MTKRYGSAIRLPERPQVAVLGLLASALLGATACAPADPGECDPTDLQHVYYDALGHPTYAGQALVKSTCAAGVCHAAFIDSSASHGVPGRFEFDVGIVDATYDKATELERLRRARRLLWNWRADVWDAVRSGAMPPTSSAGNPQEWHDSDFRYLPTLSTPEGKEILRNWLACGVPVVEGTEEPGSGDVGDIVPLGPPLARCEAPGLTPCGATTCFDLATDHDHCGACGVACGPAQACDAGRCVCSSGLAACGDICTELATDAFNCGACGVDCGTRVCTAGACADTCPMDRTNCVGSCVDLTTSAANCGDCGHVCGPGQSCTASDCVCEGGLTACGVEDACVDLSTSNANCGTCGNICRPGTTCAAGACVCGPGQTLCGAACVDLSGDSANCGGCGSACPSGQACNGGVCASCGPSATLSSIQANTFTPSCATMGCHTGASPQAGLSLAAGRSYGGLVNIRSTCGGRTLVVPGSPSSSYLLDKLWATPGICGLQMPKRGASIPSAQLAAIEAWICNGALNN